MKTATDRALQLVTDLRWITAAAALLILAIIIL